MTDSTVRSFLAIVVAVAVPGALSLMASCESRSLDSGQQLLLLDDSPGHSGPLFRTSDCPTVDGPPLSRACMIDSNGRIYPQNGTMFVFPAAPPYGAFFEFRPGFEPVAADVNTTGPAISVGAFAAPYDVGNSPCCPEDNPANQVAARATLATERGLLVTVNSALPIGTQIEIGLGFGTLFKSQLNPCTLPDARFCGFANASGFVVRFYVGAVPSGASTSAPTPSQDAGPPPEGACLLSYNTALVDGDPCCYSQGGKNTCNRAIACNARSGPGCCTIYGSENTSYGSRCCLYESGGSADGAEECALLLSGAR